MKEPTLDTLQNLYQPISADDPCGVALERTDFLKLDELCAGKPGGYDHLNERDLPPTPPNFRGARTEALQLLERTRDLRPLAYLVQIEARLGGPLALHASLHLLAQTVEEQWDAVHPGPADDSQAESLRRRALDRLRDRRAVVAPLEDAAIVAADAGGDALQVRDLLLCAEAIQPREGEIAMDRARLVERVRPEDARKQVATVREAMEASAEIYSVLDQKFAELLSRPIALGPIASELTRLAQAIKGFEDEADGAAPSEDTGEATDGAEPSTAELAQDGRPGLGGLSSEEDADALLDDMVSYYASQAPSSPIMLILLKLQELRGASFADWIRATGSNGPEKSALDLSEVDMSRLAGSETPDEDGGTGGGQDLGAMLEQGCAELQQALNATGEVFPDVQARLDTLSATVGRAQSALRAAQAVGAAVGTATGQITSRAAVKSALEQLARYRETKDPASAVPTILRRTKGLVDLNYLDILAEMSPGGGNPTLPLIKPEPKGRG